LTNAIDQVNDHVQAIGHLALRSAAVRKVVIAKHVDAIQAIETGDGKRASQAVTEYLEAAEQATCSVVSRISSKSSSKGA
jgi:DNA-binding FadR family transcriptional regulator